jgi:hypothetical protein
MTQTKCRTVYRFEELSEDVQQTTLEKYYDINVDYEDWNECILDDAKTIGALIGIQVDRIYYSGFYTQGDGACFEGSYTYQKGGLKALTEYAPQDTELHRIARGLQNIQRPYFYQLTATVEHSGHYYHDGCTLIAVERDYESVDYDTQEELSEILRDFMRWIYRQLESEYEFQTDEEQVKETILMNDYQFNENGTLDY